MWDLVASNGKKEIVPILWCSTWSHVFFNPAQIIFSTVDTVDTLWHKMATFLQVNPLLIEV